MLGCCSARRYEKTGWWVVGLWFLFAWAWAGAGARVWQPGAWKDVSTLSIRTQAEGERPHWFKVWLVVIDGDLYVRLGKRAASRVRENSTGKIVAVRVGGVEFPAVRLVPAPEMTRRVADAMAEKYWTDIFVRHFAHPLVAVLVPVEEERGTRGVLSSPGRDAEGSEGNGS